MSVGLVLEGGGMRGVFTAGVLSVLERAELKFKTITGVSAGALTAIGFLSGQPRRSYSIFVDYAADPRYMGVSCMRESGTFFNLDFILKELSYDLLPLDFDAIFANETELLIGVTDCVTGKAHAFAKSELDEAGLLEALRASASLPLISPIVTIGEGEYLDGGIADPIPIERSIAAGNDLNVVVLTRPDSYVCKPEVNANILRQAYKKYPEFVETLSTRHENYARQQQLVRDLEQEGKAVVIRPDSSIKVGRYERRPERLAAFYDAALYSAFDKLDDIQKMIQSEEIVSDEKLPWWRTVIDRLLSGINLGK